MYFTKDTDKAIVEFQNSTDDKEKHKIFNDSIRPAFEALIQGLIFVYGFYNVDDVETLKRECLANLYETLPKFNATLGTKGFSFFNVVAKNFFIHKTRERNKRIKSENDLYVGLDHESVKSDPNFIVSHHEEVVEEKEKWTKFYEAMDSWGDKLSKKTEKQVLAAVVFLMKNPDLVSIYNKKAVYLYLRELTNLNTKQVVVNLKKIKALYDAWNESYESTGE